MKTHTLRSVLPLAVALIGLQIAAPAFATDAQAQATGCARQFEAAQKLDMESFRDYDAETFRAVHTDDALTVFTSGAVRYGIDNIMAAMASHFANREALWSWTELYRNVDGCKSAYILYETVYEIPSINFRLRAMTGVTYTHNGNTWLAIADQGTPLP